MSRFVIGDHNLNEIGYADNTVLVTDTEKKTTRNPTDISEGKRE